MPEVAIIIPTRNRRELLEETLGSVLCQTLQDWEAIVVDDGSDDGTPELVKQISQRDGRVRYLPRAKEISGANVCRNQGAAATNSEFLVFLDSDDLLAPDCLMQRVAWMTRNADLDFIVCHADAFLKSPGDLGRSASTHSLEAALDRFLYFDLPWLITGPTWRRSSFERLGGFAEDIPSWQDVEFHIRAIIAGVNFLSLPSTDYHVRWQSDPEKTSIKQKRSPQHLQIGERLLDQFHQMLVEKKLLTWTRLRSICGVKYFLTKHWLNIGECRAAFQLWSRARGMGQIKRCPYYLGLLLILLNSTGLGSLPLVPRIIGRLEGIMRFRNQPEILK